MKKFIRIILTLALTFGLAIGLAGCGGDDGDKTKIGFLFIGSIEDGGFTQAHYLGVQALEEEYDGKIEVMYKEEIADTDAQAINTATQQLLDEGCKVVVGTSFGYMDYLEKFSKKYPDNYFLHFSGYKSNDTNFDNYFGAMEEPRYLAGMIAGSMTKTNKLGYVAAFDLPEVMIGINAFTLGVQAVNPKAEVKVVYINSWYDPTKEKQAAEELLIAGCDVIEQHCDTTGPQVAAEEKGGYALGYNFDNEGAAAPKAYLTAPIWNHSVYLIKTIGEIMDGTFKPNSYYGNMQDGFVGLGKMTDLIPKDVQDLVNKKSEEMAAGTFAPFSGAISYADGSSLCKEGQTLTREEIWATPNGKLVKGASTK